MYKWRDLRPSLWAPCHASLLYISTMTDDWDTSSVDQILTNIFNHRWTKRLHPRMELLICRSTHLWEISWSVDENILYKTGSDHHRSVRLMFVCATLSQRFHGSQPNFPQTLGIGSRKWKICYLHWSSTVTRHSSGLAFKSIEVANKETSRLNNS